MDQGRPLCSIRSSLASLAFPPAHGTISMPTIEMKTTCETRASRAASSRRLVPSTSTCQVPLPARWTTTSMPWTASARPVDSSHARDSRPHSSASPPGGPVFPRRRSPEYVACYYPFLFLCALHASLRGSYRRQESTSRCDTPLVVSVLLWAYNKREGERRAMDESRRK